MRTENVEWFFVQTFLTTLSVTASRKRCQAGGNCRVQLAVNGGAASGCFFGHRWGSLWLRAAVGATPCWRAPAAERQGVLWRSNVIKLSCTISPLRSIESIPSSLISIDLSWSQLIFHNCLRVLLVKIIFADFAGGGDWLRDRLRGPRSSSTWCRGGPTPKHHVCCGCVRLVSLQVLYEFVRAVWLSTWRA